MINSTNAIEGMEKVLQHDEAGDSDSEIPHDEKLMKDEEDTFYSQSTDRDGDDNIWGLLSGVGGNIYEWYDFAVYGLLAPEIGAAFFPDSSPELQLVNSFGVYLAAFLMRPLGAIFFGEIGDRILGRKNALVFSIILITVPSVLMGLLPGYDQWGITAPILLVILRMLQGLSVGGQLAGSYVISIEQSSSKNRGFRGSICDASSVGGFLLASAMTSLVRRFLTEEQVNSWGWRVPFWISLLLAPVLYFIINNAEDSKVWEERTEHKETEKIIREQEDLKNPAFVDLLSSPFRRRQLFGMVGVLGAITGSFYILFLFTPVYLSILRGYMSEADADLMTFIIVACYICMVIFFGRISDTFPHRMDLMKIGIIGLIVSCPVMFGMFECESVFGYFLAQLQFAFVLAIVEGGKAAWEVELWMNDPSLSFTGVAIGHNLASTLFGGTMPLIATFLYYRSDVMASDDEDAFWPRLIPAFYISVLACMALSSLNYLIRHPHDVRTGDVMMREAEEKKSRKRAKTMKKKKKEMIQKLESSLSIDDTFLSSYIPPSVQETTSGQV
mmetsp:Transcript_2657/g.3873  ORF Transcript_2657/g.3873 Transcript_2657/m.3873 type:complete len:556 (+) Transcript_2657:183-1850(+)